jgi:hypothetical protein
VPNAIKNGSIKSIDEGRLQDAVNVILTLQNEDGGTPASPFVENKYLTVCTYYFPLHCIIHKAGQPMKIIVALHGMNN